VLTLLGLLGMLAFISCVIALAAGVTWVVVRYSSPQRADQPR
jgi:hypothetical protein